MKYRKKRSGSDDRSRDRWIHDIMSATLTNGREVRKDACLDAGVKEHGSQHRKHFPHRSLSEMVMYMTWRDVVDGKTPDVLLNSRLVVGHAIVDSLPSHLKERMKLMQQIAGMFLKARQ